MFKLDEAMINEQFGRRLDIMTSRVASRSVDFPVIGWLPLLRLPSLMLLRVLGREENEIGLQIVFTNQLLKQRSKDAIELIMQKISEDMATGVITQHYSIGYPLIVGPLMFEYTEGVVVIDIDADKGALTTGVEVVVSASVKWNSLG